MRPLPAKRGKQGDRGGLFTGLSITIFERIHAMSQNKLRLQGGLFGVCGGLGAFFGIHPWWFRIAFILLMLPGGLPGIIIYLIMWIIIPRKENS